MEPQDGREPFDAVAAVAELEAAMAKADADSEDTADGTARYIETLEKEVLELNDLLESKEAQLSEATTRVEQAREEIEQAKARLSADAERQIARRVRDVLASLIEVLDDLDRALSGASDANPTELLTGVGQVRRQFLAKLAALGVRPQEALDRPFDPTRHHAVTTAPASDPDQRGKVVAVLRPGYAMGDDLLRPAMVVVAK